MSVVENVVEMKKNKRSKTHHGEPRKPEMVTNIIQWRDKEKKTWQAIGDEYGMTRAGARHLYHRWYDWWESKRASGE